MQKDFGFVQFENGFCVVYSKNFLECARFNTNDFNKSMLTELVGHVLRLLDLEGSSLIPV